MDDHVYHPHVDSQQYYYQHLQPQQHFHQIVTTPFVSIPPQRHMHQLPPLAYTSLPMQSEYTQEFLSNKKLSEIKEILKSQGKKVTGNKEDLIARILGVKELALPVTSRPRRRTDDDSDDEDIRCPKKRIHVDRDDPAFHQCFLCHAMIDLIKYKDVKICSRCKAEWKGKRLLKDQACQMFALEPDDLVKLPHKELPPSHGGISMPQTPLYAFATAAGAAVKKYGSLFLMIKENPNQRELLAQYIQNQHQLQQQQYDYYRRLDSQMISQSSIQNISQRHYSQEEQECKIKDVSPSNNEQQGHLIHQQSSVNNQILQENVYSNHVSYPNQNAAIIHQDYKMNTITNNDNSSNLPSPATTPTPTNTNNISVNRQYKPNSDIKKQSSNHSVQILN